MRRTLLYVLALVLCVLTSRKTYSQNLQTVSGVVTAADDKLALPGVSVSVSGTTSGTQTDATGKFTINAAVGSVLRFTYVGYNPQSITVAAGQTTRSVVLTAVARELSQVVVVGYGTQRRRDVTGSVASVRSETLVRQQVQTPVQAIQGQAAGVQVIASGEPNDQPSVRIRGTGTILAGAEPLYVVDGVITTDIRNINNADIVSVDVLKDASSTAIYGMRGANGVIILTTKQGKTGKPVVSYNGTVGFREVGHLVKMASANQYTLYLKDASPSTVLPATPANTPWYNAILRKGFQQNHAVSVAGGSENSRYYFSAGYLTDNGIGLNNDFERITLTTRLDFTLSPKLNLSAKINYSNGNDRLTNFAGAFADAYRAPPLIPVRVGGLYGNTSAFGNVGNPLLDLNQNYQREVLNRLQGNLTLSYNPVPALRLASSISPDISFSRKRTYDYQFLNDQNTFTTAGGNQQNLQSGLTVLQTNAFRYVWDNTATFNKRFDKHSLTVLAGITTELGTTDALTGATRDVPPDPNQWYLNAGNRLYAINAQTGDKFTRRSFLGRLNYAYADKYLLTASLRNDGTSKFPASNRTDYFPSLGLGWVVSSEDFMQHQTFFQYLKLRGSYGKVGNDGIATSQYIVTGNTFIPYFFGGQPAFGTTIDQVKDPNLRWEITTEYDAALEFSTLGSHLSGEIDYYRKITNNALFPVPLSANTGDPRGSYITNIGSISNKGWEATLSWKDKLDNGISYRASVNATFNKNLLSKLSNAGQALYGGNINGFPITRTDAGQPIGSYYVLQTTGVFQRAGDVAGYVNSKGQLLQPTAKPGSLKYGDLNGDGVIDQNDRKFAGSYQPKAYFGANLGIDYKGWDLSADFYGNLGNKIYNAKKQARLQPTDNVEASFADKRWLATRPSTTDPNVIDRSTPASTYFIESGSFLRLNNLTLGYSLPKSLLEHGHIGTIRFYVTSQNLFTLTKYTGFSPEVKNSSVFDTNGAGTLSPGVELNAYPTTRTFAFGINVTF